MSFLNQLWSRLAEKSPLPPFVKGGNRADGGGFFLFPPLKEDFYTRWRVGKKHSSPIRYVRFNMDFSASALS